MNQPGRMSHDATRVSRTTDTPDDWIQLWALLRVAAQPQRFFPAGLIGESAD